MRAMVLSDSCNLESFLILCIYFILPSRQTSTPNSQTAYALPPMSGLSNRIGGPLLLHSQKAGKPASFITRSPGPGFRHRDVQGIPVDFTTVSNRSPWLGVDGETLMQKNGDNPAFPSQSLLLHG